MNEMTRSERAAWKVQNVFRRWTVLLVINLVALLWLWFGNDEARNWWNYAWSALAVDVEFVTALALVSLARRDHDSIDEVKFTARRLEKLEQHILAIVDHLQIDQERKS